MRNIPAAMKAQIEEGATTFCHCWRIDRNFLPPLGFTDHDEDIAFDGVLFEAASGFEASEVERSLGLSIDNASAKGALSSAKIAEEDIQSGVYDGARVRQWLVDWRDPESRFLTFKGDIGEIRRGASVFEVELRGLSERLNRPVGRHFLHVCDAELGDGRCGFDLGQPGFRGQASVLAVEDARTLKVSGIGGFAEGWFDDGVMTWLSGERAGRVDAIAVHRRQDGVRRLVLEADMTPKPAIGDEAELSAGCDKRMETCRDKFLNLVNFRGFPFIPGDGWSAAYPVDGEDHDGGSRG